MIKLIKETFRRENADKTMSDEEIENETKPQIEEVNQMIQRLGELRRIDTSSLMAEFGSDNENDQDHEDEANEGDVDTKDEKAEDNPNNRGETEEKATVTVCSRPPKRTHPRNQVWDQSFRPRGRANLRAIAEIITRPQSKVDLGLLLRMILFQGRR